VSAATRGWRLDGDGWTTADSLPLTDRGFRYGMSVFETIGVRDGQALFVEQHAKLLSSSAKNLLGIDFRPVAPPLEPDDRGILRIYITAGDGGPANAAANPRVFALFEPVSGQLPDDQSARLHPEPVTPFAHGAKTGNYWAQCAAQAAARAAGFDHALLSDDKGRLLSAAMGNVFFVRDGALCTPAFSLAVRPGVIRSWVMAQESVREVEASADSLENAQEVFLTNSRLGVMPLRFGKVEPGPVGCALRDTCRRKKIIP
jgi:branched-subunit amino acid aminotransferase/4-amino-4-deoxychorismate lyase